MTLSIRSRLLGVGSLVLAVFILLAAAALDQAYEHSAEQALIDRGQSRIYALLAAVNVESGKVSIPGEMPEARFSQLGSGLYAEIQKGDGDLLWRSTSATGQTLPSLPFIPQTGVWQQAFVNNVEGNEFYATAYQVEWENQDGGYSPYRFVVYEDTAAYRAQIASFRKTLWTWLGGMGLLLVLVQAVLLVWGLRPLNRIAGELDDMEKGRRDALSGDYPRELKRLAGNLNTLLSSEKRRLEQYRNALGDLSHSLKTPLAILHGETYKPDEKAIDRGLLGEQIGRMTRTIEYHLQKAAAAGQTALAKPIAVKPMLEQIVRGLNKVYADKGIDCDLLVEDSTMFIGDKGDLMELAGNLLDNAYKWSRNQVKVRAQLEQGRFLLQIEDDGPGVAPALREAIQQRGTRADVTVEGQGLGLAMVRQIVDLYHGEMRIADSQMGGARFEIILPQN